MASNYDRNDAGRKGLDKTPDANPDPITGEHGAHPIGTGIGATGGGLAGAAIGAIGGPIGIGIGAAVGAIVGGLAGKGAGEALNPTVENEYWQNEYRNRPYVKREAKYEEYAPAYRYGWENAATYGSQGRRFDEVEPELAQRWSTSRGSSTLEWNNAKDAARDAWSRVEGRSDKASYAGSAQVADDKEVRSTLNDLVKICKDGVYGFRTAADKVDGAYADLFRQFAAERDQLAAELQNEVSRRGGDPDEGGDAVGAIHRGWINLKSALTGGQKAIIDEAERGEDAAVAAYRKALEKRLPADVETMLNRQYAKVKAAHDRVRNIKHSMA